MSETSIPGGKPFPSLRDLTGTVIDGRYEVGQLLGCGGMGAVYEAMQLRLDRRVAIKILNPVYMHRDDYVTRFMREAKAASRIRHENVVQVLDFGELESGSVYSVMEFLEGRDLAQLLQAEIKLPWRQTRDLLMQMARGLKAAHAEGVIHRDIKPANLFLVPDPSEGRDILKVLDFGIARLQTSTQHTAGLTGTAELLGTPSYMAPELARGKAANPRTEVYSVGVVAYRMVTGHLPFEGQTAFDVLFRSATEPAPPLRTHEPDVPAAIEALVLRMLAKDPEDRFPDMATLFHAIAAVDEEGRLQGDRMLPTGPHAALDARPGPPAGYVAAPDRPTRRQITPAPSPLRNSVREEARDPVDDPAGAPAHDPITGPGAPREATMVTPDMGSGPVSGPIPVAAPPESSPSDSNAPQVVIPPPLSVSPSRRAALAATRAARAGQSSPFNRLDPATGPASLQPGVPSPESAASSGPMQVTPDPRGGDVTFPIHGIEPTPAPGPAAAPGPHDASTLPIIDTPMGADSASGNVAMPLPSASGVGVVRSIPYDGDDLDEVPGRAAVPRWIVAAGIGVLALVGVIALASSGDDEPPAPAPGAKTVISAPPVEAEPSSPPRPTTAAPSVPAPLEPDPVATPAPQDDPGEIEIDDEPEPSAPEPPSPAPAPKPATSPKPAKPDTPATQPRTTPKPAPAPEKPPTDAQVIRRLQRQAERKCGKLLGGEPITVKFGIGDNGKTLASRADRGGVAARCVLDVVDGAEFAPGKMRKGKLDL